MSLSTKASSPPHRSAMAHPCIKSARTRPVHLCPPPVAWRSLRSSALGPKEGTHHHATVQDNSSHDREKLTRGAATWRAAALRGAAASAAVAGCLFSSALQQPAALAIGPVKIPLEDMVMEVVTCPPGTRAFGGYDQTRCLNVTARAFNGSNKPFFNVDVFGRVYDANGNNALDRDDASDAGRVTNIPKVEPGESTVTFPLRVSEAQARAGELKLKSFKAVGYPGAAFSPLLDECTDELGELQLGGECSDELAIR